MDFSEVQDATAVMELVQNGHQDLFLYVVPSDIKMRETTKLRQYPQSW